MLSDGFRRALQHWQGLRILHALSTSRGLLLLILPANSLVVLTSTKVHVLAF